MIKNYDLITFVENFNSIKDVSGNLEFTKAVVKNYKNSLEELKLFDKLHEPSVKYKEFLQKKDEAILKYCERDESNSPVFTILTVGGKDFRKYSIKDEDAYQKEFENLKEEYKETLKEHEDKEERFKEALLMDLTMEIAYVNEKSLPEGLSPEQLLLIDWFIKYD